MLAYLKSLLNNWCLLTEKCGDCMRDFHKLDVVLEELGAAVRNKDKIALYGDYDVDGLMSLMICEKTLSLMEHKEFFLYPYYSRTHEIDFNLLNFCLSRKINIVVICDTGSNNMDLLNKFCAYGIRCIVLDHHVTPYAYDDFPKECSVINTFVDEHYFGINNTMCGASVVFCVCTALLDRYDISYDIGYLAIYALLAQYADAVPMDTDFGKELYSLAINRKSVPRCVDYFMESYSEITRRFAEYTFAPKINAIFRREQFSLINKLFLEPAPDAFLLVNQIKELHVSTLELVDVMLERLAETWEDVNGIVVVSLTPLLNLDISNNFILNHKGRIANKIANIEGKPCICVCDSGKEIEGSFRDLEGRDFLKYFSPLYKAGGHPPAFGFSIPYVEWSDFFGTVKTVGKVAAFEGLSKVSNPIYDMTRWFDLDMLKHIAFKNEFATPGKPATYVKITLNRIVESTKYGLSYLLYSDGIDKVWFSSDKKIQYPQTILLYPYLQKNLKLQAMWR